MLRDVSKCGLLDLFYFTVATIITAKLIWDTKEFRRQQCCCFCEAAGLLERVRDGRGGGEVLHSAFGARAKCTILDVGKRESVIWWKTSASLDCFAVPHLTNS